MKPIIIVGSGMAGYTVAREVRKLDREIPITIISADSGDFYSKPMLSNAFLLGKDAASLVNSTAQQMAAQLNAGILSHATVEAIDTRAHTVTVALAGASQVLPYSSLVLALGADQRRIRLGGNAADEVLTINDLEDYGRFRAALDGCLRVAILGAGLIGCEFANDLAAQFDVALVDPANWPLNRLLPEPQGLAMAAALEDIGVEMHLGKTPTSIDRRGKTYLVRMSGGETLEVDRVVAAIGLVPRTELAKTSGLAVARGIVTNAWLCTSAPDVYALGDCAEVDGLVLPYIMPIMQAARALAKTLTGESTRVVYPVMPVQVKTPALPAVVASPLATTQGQWQVAMAAADVEQGGNGVWEYRNAENEMHGFALIGEHVKQKNALLTAMASKRS
ncbi:MAG: FAD-dependent oxidoreductase [Pseudomonadota bacterium]